MLDLIGNHIVGFLITWIICLLMLKYVSESRLNFEVVQAIDVNTNANEIYKLNFPETPVSSSGIEVLSLCVRKHAISVADPGFLKRGFKCRKEGFVCLISHKFLEIPHENEIIWVQRGVRMNLLNPSESSTEFGFPTRSDTSLYSLRSRLEP